MWSVIITISVDIFLSVVAIFCGVWTFFVEYGHFLSGVVSGHYNKCGHFLLGVAIFCGVWTFLVECGHFLSGVGECGHYKCGHLCGVWTFFCGVWIFFATTVSVDSFCGVDIFSQGVDIFSQGVDNTVL